jgi:hypothetical protein
MYSVSSSIKNADALCDLALNVINEKIFIALMFWFAIVATVTAYHLVLMLAVSLIPSLRWFWLRLNANIAYKKKIGVVLNNASAGEYFMINLICKNMDTIMVKEFIYQLAAKKRRMFSRSDEMLEM